MHILCFSFFVCIIGRRKPASIRPRGEGVYVAKLTSQAEGPHRININWSDQAVPQRYDLFSFVKINEISMYMFYSPFNVKVLPHFEPNKVTVDGPGICDGLPASLETYFRIDTREAGVENPNVLIKVKEQILEIFNQQKKNI